MTLEELYSPRRVFVNCPSQSQAHHSLHGKVGIAVKQKGRPFVRVYFTEGEIMSVEIAPTYLSPKYD